MTILRAIGMLAILLIVGALSLLFAVMDPVGWQAP
jgi:hypothetical protein